MAGLVRSIENDQDMETPVYAATALIAFAADARTAEPALAAMMRSGNVDEVRVAGDLLTRLDPPAVESLLAALQDRHCVHKVPIIGFLGRLGPRANLAFPCLAKLLDAQVMGTVENAPRAAADALLAIVRTRAISLVAPRLSKWSKEFNEHRIIALLEDIGNASPEVVPTLVKFLRHEQAAVRRAAAATLGRIRPAADAAIPALRACVSDKKQSLRSEAIIALARIRRDQETLNLLSKDVQDSECETGARLLGDAGREARLALPVLKKQAANPVFALACLRIEPPPVGLGAGREAWDRATAELATVMDRPENFFRSSYRSHGFEAQEQARRIRDAMGALLSRLRKSSSLRQELTAALRDPKVETRLLAAVALAPLKDRPPDLDADIAGMLRKRPYLLCYLADTLTVLGSDNKTVRPWLARYLTHDNPAAYDEAVRLLVKSDPQAIRKIWGPLGMAASSGSERPSVRPRSGPTSGPCWLP